MQGRELSWENAGSLADLGRVTAAWLRGEVDDHPCCGGGPDPETSAILPDLLLLNQRGFVTTFSQPGESIDAGNGQRAAVEGFAEETLARALGSLTLSTDLLVFIYEPFGVGGYQVPITIVDFHPFTWCGSSSGPDDLHSFAEFFSPAGIHALSTAWRVVAIDPRWGRSRYLWRHLCRVTHSRKNDRWDITPSVELELDTDLVR